MPIKLSELKKKITDLKTKDIDITDDDFKVAVIFLLKAILDK